jgi:hypothetical protein
MIEDEDRRLKWDFRQTATELLEMIGETAEIEEGCGFARH